MRTHARAALAQTLLAHGALEVERGFAPLELPPNFGKAANRASRERLRVFSSGEPTDALIEAEAAYAARAALGRLEISDARIDVALADALLGTGQPERAAEVFAEGRRRLEEVTARWDDASLRASYLEGVATHRRIVEATSG